MGKFGDAAMDFGFQTAQGIVGAGMGLLMQKGQDKRQLRQEQKLQDIEITGQKQMADYNYGLEMKKWQDTGYKAQMEQLKEAGLNPGMIYGMGGAGGQTSATQGVVS